MNALPLPLSHARPRSPAALVLALALALALVSTACASRSRSVEQPQPLPVRADLRPGDCADPTRQGVFGPSPSLWRADRDLDGDDVNELVVADRSLCTREGNCHWNLYRTEGECYRYLGTVSAVSIQRVLPRGEGGFYGVRALWRLGSERRVLVQEYRFRRGGYRLIDVLLCLVSDGDRMVCSEQGR